MQQISDAVLLVNDEVVGYVPNSLKYTEGFGEQKIRPISIGGGKTEQAFARDIESALSKIMFELITSVENIKSARTWKANGNANVVQISSETVDGNFTRTFTQAVLTGDYEVEIGSDGNISVEMQSNSAI